MGDRNLITCGLIDFVNVIILNPTSEHTVILNEANSPGLFELPKRKGDVNTKFVLLLFTQILSLIESNLKDLIMRVVNSFLARTIILPHVATI